MVTSNSKPDITSEPKEEEIRVQLNRIIADSEFVRSPKIARFLNYVVEETIKGRKEFIKAFTIANIVFEKNHNFDPQSDPIVRVNAVRLRRMLRHYYKSAGINDNIIIDIVKGSYIPNFYYRKHLQNQTISNYDLAQTSSFPSVAVLSFKNDTNNDAYNFFADGITHEIIAQLSKIKEIVVIARFTINSKEDDYRNTQQLRQSIDVRYILSGNVLIVGDKIRVFVELDDAFAYANIWTNTYSRDYSISNLIAIQDDIASHVAVSIAQPYGVISRRELVQLQRTSTNNLTAYQHFLHFYQWVLTLSESDHLIARESLEQAVIIDPSFSDAWSALAIIYNAEYQFSFNPLKRERDVRDLAYEAARTALKCDPDNARAHYSLVFTRMARAGTRACLDEAEKAYLLNSNNSLLIAIHGFRLALCGEWERGLELVEQAIVFNNSHPDFYYIPFVINYYRIEDYESALQEARKINMPAFFWTHLILAPIYSEMGDTKHAGFHSKELIKLYPGFEKVARYELEKWDIQSNLVEKILGGLKKTGLDID